MILLLYKPVSLSGLFVLYFIYLLWIYLKDISLAVVLFIMTSLFEVTVVTIKN